MEIVERLVYFRRWRRQLYSRGFRDGFFAACAIVGFFVVYVYTGGAP